MSDASTDAHDCFEGIDPAYIVEFEADWQKSVAEFECTLPSTEEIVAELESMLPTDEELVTELDQLLTPDTIREATT